MDKTTTFAEKQITTASCVVLISHCNHQLLVRTVLNCIYLRACYHQNIVKTKHRIFSAEVWYIQINFSFTILMLQNHLYVIELLMLLNLQKNSAWLIFSSEFQQMTSFFNILYNWRKCPSARILNEIFFPSTYFI